MVLSLHTKSFKYLRPDFIHLRQAEDSGTIQWHRKKSCRIYGRKKKKKDVKWHLWNLFFYRFAHVCAAQWQRNAEN